MGLCCTIISAEQMCNVQDVRVTIVGVNMEFLQSHREALCPLMSKDLEKLLDHIEDMVTLKQCRTVNGKGGKEGAELLLEIMLEKGEDECQKFVEIMKKNYPEVQKLSVSECKLHYCLKT